MCHGSVDRSRDLGACAYCHYLSTPYLVGFIQRVFFLHRGVGEMHSGVIEALFVGRILLQRQPTVPWVDKAICDKSHVIGHKSVTSYRTQGIKGHHSKVIVQVIREGNGQVRLVLEDTRQCKG